MIAFTTYTTTNIRPFLGNIKNFSYMAVAILSYLILYLTYQYLFRSENKLSKILLLCSELILLIPLYTFSLVNYSLFLLLVILKLSSLFYSIFYVYKNSEITDAIGRPNYDLLVLAVIYAVMAYTPELFENKFSILNIKIFVNSCITACCLILTGELLKHLRIHNKI